MNIQYKVGAPINVFVSKTDPRKSVLDKNFDMRILISSPIFFGFLLVMLLESLGLQKLFQVKFGGLINTHLSVATAKLAYVIATLWSIR